MDPRLEHNYPLEGAKQSAALILKCLQSEPKSRPTSVEVLEILEQINTFKLKEAETSDIAQHVEWIDSILLGYFPFEKSNDGLSWFIVWLFVPDALMGCTF